MSSGASNNVSGCEDSASRSKPSTSRTHRGCSGARSGTGRGRRRNLDKWDAEERIYWPKKDGAWPRLVRYLDELHGIAFQDVWTDIPPINMVARERAGYPTQKPEALVERIISASSNPGDLVLDCFSGSGTSAMVAQRLGRRWIAVDCGKLAVYVTQRRLLTSNGNTPTMEPASFELCSAGLYENDRLEKLSFDGYKTFCLELFGCREQPHTISDITMAPAPARADQSTSSRFSRPRTRWGWNTSSHSRSA